MKAIMLSIQSKWVSKILNGEKSIEIRKTRPRVREEYIGRTQDGVGRKYKTHHDMLPCKVYIYCSKSKDAYRLRRNDMGKFAELKSKIFTAKECEETYKILNGKVVASFMLNQVKNTCGWRLKNETGNCKPRMEWETDLPKNACLSIDEIIKYAGGKDTNSIKCWFIDDLQVFDTPKSLDDFYSVKECEPCELWGEKQTWEQRHKKNIASTHPAPIECYKCKHLIAGDDYEDKKSGVMVFDYDCKTNHHAPLKTAPQSWCYVEVAK
jgi:hypothetical protein